METNIHPIEVDIDTVDKIKMPDNFDEVLKKWERRRKHADKIARLRTEVKYNATDFRVRASGISIKRNKKGNSKKWKLPAKQMR